MTFYYSPLQSMRVHDSQYSPWQSITVHDSLIQCMTLHYSILQSITVHDSQLQSITVHDSLMIITFLHSGRSLAADPWPLPFPKSPFGWVLHGMPLEHPWCLIVYLEIHFF